MTLKTSEFATATDFLAYIEPDLGPREVECHLLFGIARAARERTNPGTVLATVEDETVLALAAFMTPPRPLVLVSTRSDLNSEIAELAQWLRKHDHTPRALIADVALAERFVLEWTRLSGASAELKMRQRLHVLRRVIPVTVPAGELRRASMDDLELLERWVGAFHSEALGESSDPELRDRVAVRLDTGEFFLWEDGEPRAMAASARPTRRGIAVNSVYTPLEFRGRGYATAAVAALSRRLLDDGREFCVLYTDVANPTSNAIYARVGYQPVADSLLYEFIYV
ncbi:MAG: GNAT family N-acetyltransferase [Gemmatimonadaceae bacterium]